MKNLLKRAASLTLASSVLFGIAACGDTSSSLNTGLTQDQAETFGKKISKDGEADILHLVHLAGDNNLHQFALEDLNEMEAGINNPKVKVIVLFDGAKQGDSAVYEVEKDPAGMNKIIVSKKVANPIIPANNEIDSGDYKVAAKFVDWAVSQYPAKKHIYTVWNHGLDWQRIKKNSFASKPVKNAINEISTNEFAWDDNGSNMKTADLNPILDPAAKKLGKKFDILNFDACLMAHAEVGFQVANSVDYLVASQDTEPGAGNPYHFIEKTFSDNSTMSGTDMAKAMVKDYARSYKTGITLSAMDLSKVSTGFTSAVNEFADVMVANLSKDNAVLQELRKKTTVFDNNDCADISHFASLVIKDARVSADVKAAAAKVVAEVSSSVIENANTVNANAKGISMYFPYKGLSYKNRYDTLKFSTNKWDEFLKAFIK